MELRSERELENSRRKLRDLERWHTEAGTRNKDNERVRVATQTSLKRLINQLKEEITRYESRQVAAGRSRLPDGTFGPAKEPAELPRGR